jgi:hypothetical protein
MRRIRVAPHVHSTWSYDGRWPLESLASAFARRGYDAVLMAEHDRTFDPERWRRYREACAEASAGGALLVPGIEYSDPENRVHVPVWGAEGFLGRDRPTGPLLQQAAAAGGVAVIAHPGRRDAHAVLEPAWLEHARGVEVWNRKYDGWAPGDAGTALAARTGLAPFVGLDFHTARQFFPLALTGPVAGPVTLDGVLTALRAGELRPTVFRMPAARLAHGPGLGVARAGEQARRRVARASRRVRQPAARR